MMKWIKVSFQGFFGAEPKALSPSALLGTFGSAEVRLRMT
jgi:hypothetical protein